MSFDRRCIFITGATGYMARHLIPRLLERGDQIRALVRPASEAKLPSRCEVISGNALDGSSYAAAFLRLIRLCSWWACRISALPKRLNFAASI